jgi:hypothetical protein
VWGVGCRVSGVGGGSAEFIYRWGGRVLLFRYRWGGRVLFFRYR